MNDPEPSAPSDNPYAPPLTNLPGPEPVDSSASAGPRRPPRVLPALLAPIAALVVAVVLQAVVLAVVAAVLVAQGADPDGLGERLGREVSNPPVLLAMIVVGPGAFGVAAVVAAWLSPVAFKERLGLRPVRDPVRVYSLTMIGSIVPLAAAIAAANFVATFTPHDESFVAFFEAVTPGIGVVFVVLVALVPGFCEEMLFRGYIQQRLVDRWGPAAGITVASVLFALAHVMPPSIALALPLGVWLGWIGWRTGSIGPCIACHAFVNGGLNAWRLVAKFAELSDETIYAVHGVLLLIGAAAFLLACRTLAAYPQPPRSGPGEADPAE